jgi:UDP-GlcNAc:undecaprenyl-phosphate/decaprenyl-phosphate GlcNAc-1-phosphate transferase
MTSFVLICLLTSFWTAFLATFGMRWLAPRLGLIDRPAARKVHTVPTPLGGGIGIWCGVMLPLLAGQLVALGWLPIPTEFVGAEFGRHLAGAAYRGPQLWAVMIAGTVLAIAGLADDFRPLPWQSRLGLQFAVAAIIVAFDVRVSIFHSDPWIGRAITVLWFVVLVNSFNFLDNMDGLSSGIALIVSVMFAAMMLNRVGDPRWLVGGFFLVLAGSLCGFLVHNWNPARIFMGDSGSYFIGFSIAAMTVLGTFYSPDDPREHAILAPLCVLAIPLYDITSVVWLRLREGRSPFQPDKRHFSHRLVALGLKPVQAVMTVHLTTLTTGLAGLTLYSLSSWTAALLPLAIVGCILMIVAILEFAPRPPARDPAA